MIILNEKSFSIERIYIYGLSMKKENSATFTRVELEFMQILWKNDDISAEDVRSHLKEQGRTLTDGSVRKILQILVNKGHLARNKKGRKYMYKVTTSDVQAEKRIVGDMLDRAFQGNVPSLVAALLETKNVSRKDLEEIRRLISKYENEGTV